MASPVAPAPAPAPAVAERFDFKVRQDFFDGLRGDKAALDRSMKVCEDALAKNANDPEPLVWHGAGTIALASLAFRAGDPQTGIPMFKKGLAEMNRAVELAPDHVGVRIPRGAVLLTVAKFTPEPQKSALLKGGIEDYEQTLAIQGPRFATETLHAREQLLYGIVDGYASLGELDKAQSYFERMQREAAGSGLLARAQTVASGGKVEGATPCEQCHAGRR